MAFKKRGEVVKADSVHDPISGETVRTCSKCGKDCKCKMDKQAFLDGEKAHKKCPHCKCESDF